MWPFREKRVKKSNQVEEDQADKLPALVKELQAWRQIGKEFHFLGRRMVVSGHYTVQCTFPPHIYIVPGIRAYYADEMGVIRKISFNAAESAAIMYSQLNIEQKHELISVEKQDTLE